MHRGTIFNLQRYSIQDGPGIRTTVFLKGCPLRCAWCHNPEGIRREPEIVVQENHCLSCAECRRVCPLGSQKEGARTLDTHDPRCGFCGACVAVCPTKARQQIGRDVEGAELMQQILRDRVFFEESGGGVTFSGGEPFHQTEFLLSMLRACKEQGIHTTVDTCGLTALSALMRAAPFTDLFLYDLKLMDDVLHRRHTGSSNQAILENLRALSRGHENIWLRVPVIPGVNDSEDNLRETARFAASLRLRHVNLLPYHRNGTAKSRRVGAVCALPETVPPSEQAMASARGIFEKAGLVTKIGG